MKRNLWLLLCVLLCLVLVACDTEPIDHTGQAKTPAGSSAQKGRDYHEVQEEFEENGFVNIRLEK